MKKGDQTEKKIIDVALQLFVLKGYHGTSINDITKKVGVTKGALYSHFKSKSELLHKILEIYRTDYFDKLIEAINAFEGDAIAKLHKLISYKAGFATKNPELAVFLTFLGHELGADEDFEFDLKRQYRELKKFVTNLVQQGIRQGVIKKDLDPESVAMTVLSIHDGFLNQWVLNRYNLDGREFVRTSRRIFIDGIKA